MTLRRAPLATRPLALALLWSGAVVTVAALVGRYWIPLDDGTLAQSAERVLGGELPHRDFADPYTGLNAVVGAVAFRLFGVTLASLRVPLVVGFAAWLPAVWLCARRFAPPGVALTATAVAAVLSVLTYPAAMPTWFALFAVTWGLLFLHAFMDVRGRAWLAAAGAAAGIATLFKVVGLYFLAACLLSVAWRRLGTERGHRAVAAVGCGLFLVALGRLVLPGAAVSAVGLFFLPAAAVCAAVTVRRHGTAASWRTALLLDGAWLLAGFLAPVALFLAPYAVRGGVAAWLDGVLLRPALRLETASSAPPAGWTLLTGAAAVVLVALGERLGGEGRARAAAGAAAALAVGLALDDALDGAVMASLWYSLRTFVPALVVWGAWRHARGRGSGAAFATLATVALWTLVQFPYPAPAYAFYVAPLAVLATLAVVAPEPSDAGAPAPARHGRPGGPGRPFSPLLALVAGVYAFLGAGYVAGVVGSGEVPLPGDRGGILVSSEDARVYGGLMETVAAHVSGGALWAGPDAPEVYFLTGLPNRTPILYEFLTDTNPAEPAALSDGTVTVAVVNTRPLFSRPLDPSVLDRLAVRFPDARQVGPFVVRWRSP